MTKTANLPDPGPTMGVERLAVELDIAVATVYRWARLGGILPDALTDSPLCWDPKQIAAWKKTRVPGRWKHPLKTASTK